MVTVKSEAIETDENEGDNIENMLVIDEDYDTDSETIRAALNPPMKADESLEREIMKEMRMIAQDISDMDHSVLGDKHSLASKQLLSNEILSQMSVEEAMEAIHMEFEDPADAPTNNDLSGNINLVSQEKERAHEAGLEHHQEGISSNVPDLISSNTLQILQDETREENLAQANIVIDNVESKDDDSSMTNSQNQEVFDNDSMCYDSLIDNNVDCGPSENFPLEEVGTAEYFEEDPLKIDETATFFGNNSLKEAIEKCNEFSSNKTSKLCEEILKNTDSAIESIRENIEKTKTDLVEKVQDEKSDLLGKIQEEKSFHCKNKSETKLVILTSTLKQRLEADKASKTSKENKTEKEIIQGRPERNRKKAGLHLHLVKSKHGNFSVGKPKHALKEKFHLYKTKEKYKTHFFKQTISNPMF